MTNKPRRATLVEVGPRDGFQPIGPFIPTQTKIDLIRGLHASGVRRMEATAFVSPSAVPQLADAAEVLAAANALPGMDAQVLVPNAKYAERALQAGARHLAFVVSVSEKHNRNNVRRSPAESVAEYRRIVGSLPGGVAMRVNIATAFDCPFDGEVAEGEVLALLALLAEAGSSIEVALCDTTGRATADRVFDLLTRVREDYPQVSSWAFHGHDTYGQGIANVLSALNAGVTTIDAAFGGLGGCPFAPGATGNVATEDVVWTLERMGIATGLDLDLLIDAANDAVRLPGAVAGGSARVACTAARRAQVPVSGGATPVARCASA